MNFIKPSIVLFLLLFSFGLTAETTLNTESVNKLLNNIQESVRKKDADKFATYFTDDAKITIEMPSNMGGTMNLNMTQYIKMLKEGWALPAKYTYEVKDIRIKISQNKNSATVNDVTLEKIEMNGKIIASSESIETMTVVISNGTPKIKSLYGKVKL